MNNKIHKIIIFCALSFVLIPIAKAQPDYKNAPYSEESSLTALQREYYMWLDAQEVIDDSIKSNVKKYMRFESFWRGRVASGEGYQTSFTKYTHALNNYWQNPFCLGSDESQWEQVGPFPQGRSNMGFVGAVWTDPADQNFIIAGSGRNSGILRSLDGGITWEDVLTPQKIPALGITSFAVSPNKINNQRVIYASTGGYHYSVGIVKSVDNGQTWQILANNWPLNTFSHYKTRKVVVPQDILQGQNDIVYAIASDKFIK